MISPFKIISCDLGPSIFWQDVTLSLKSIFNFKKDGLEITQLEATFAKKFNSQAISFNSGRSCQMATIAALGLKKGDQVLLQAYTCVAVPNACLWSGLKAIYVDIDPVALSLDPKDLQKKITKNSKLLIIQHTFGVPSFLEEILKIAKKHKLLVIEDCAHATGIKYKGQYLGQYSDAAFFSFGRDKMLSSVYGGMVITKNEALAEKIRNYQQNLDFPSNAWIIPQLLYNPLTFLIVRSYKLFGLGKLIHFLLIQLNLFSRAVSEEEKEGHNPGYFPQKMPSVLARLALSQFSRLEMFNKKRQKICKLYSTQLSSLGLKLPIKDLPLLRFTIQTKDQDKLWAFAKQRDIYLGRWYDSPIAPIGTNLAAIGYHPGSCQVAEDIAKKSLNLPTNPNLSEEEIQKVISVVKEYYAKN